MSHDLVELYFGRRMHARLEPRIEWTEADLSPTPGGVACSMKISLLNSGGQIGRDVLTRVADVLNNSTGLSIQVVHLASPRGTASASSRPRVISHQHYEELYYQGVTKDAITFALTVDPRAVGPEKPVIFLDVYAADSRPHRYKIWRTFDKDVGWTAAWEDIGIPPAPE
jgi:hypothetical protein